MELSPIIDPGLLKHLEIPSIVSALKNDVFFVAETSFTIITATNPAFKLCEGKYLSDLPSNFNFQSPHARHCIIPALGAFIDLNSPSEDKKDGFLFIATASVNNDLFPNNIVNSLDAAKKSNKFGVAFADLGNYNNVIKKPEYQGYIDLLITYDSYTISKKDLSVLWEYLPDCSQGFLMYWAEGHHPHEPTWLRMPPMPFGFLNFALKRKIDSWGQGEYGEEVERKIIKI